MQKILIIGESCKDVFTYGDVERLSPEAPVPVFKPKEDVENFGMAANVFKNIDKLSEKSELTFWTQEEKIVKQRIVDKKTNHMLIRIDSGENELVSAIDLTQGKIEVIKNFDVVIISDYNKGFLSEEDFVTIGQNAKLLFVDTKRKLSTRIIEVCDFIKLNHQEYQNNKELVEKYPSKFIVTLGADGARYLNEKFPSPKPQETIDVSGAGDTFIASLVIKYLETNEIKESINFANKMSSIVVSKRGVVTP
jgi:D-beta-D-heptose 7-phosphate kinase/D-beta-D-heptose 1-phosphate adenosyltransferase